MDHGDDLNFDFNDDEFLQSLNDIDWSNSNNGPEQIVDFDGPALNAGGVAATAQTPGNENEEDDLFDLFMRPFDEIVEKDTGPYQQYLESLPHLSAEERHIRAERFSSFARWRAKSEDITPLDQSISATLLFYSEEQTLNVIDDLILKPLEMFGREEKHNSAWISALRKQLIEFAEHHLGSPGWLVNTWAKREIVPYRDYLDSLENLTPEEKRRYEENFSDFSRWRAEEQTRNTNPINQNIEDILLFPEEERLGFIDTFVVDSVNLFGHQKNYDPARLTELRKQFIGFVDHLFDNPGWLAAHLKERDKTYLHDVAGETADALDDFLKWRIDQGFTSFNVLAKQTKGITIARELDEYPADNRTKDSLRKAIQDTLDLSPTRIALPQGALTAELDRVMEQWGIILPIYNEARGIVEQKGIRGLSDCMPMAILVSSPTFQHALQSKDSDPLVWDMCLLNFAIRLKRKAEETAARKLANPRGVDALNYAGMPDDMFLEMLTEETGISGAEYLLREDNSFAKSLAAAHANKQDVYIVTSKRPAENESEIAFTLAGWKVGKGHAVTLVASGDGWWMYEPNSDAVRQQRDQGIDINNSSVETARWVSKAELVKAIDPHALNVLTAKSALATEQNIVPNPVPTTVRCATPEVKAGLLKPTMASGVMHAEVDGTVRLYRPWSTGQQPHVGLTNLPEIVWREIGPQDEGAIRVRGLRDIERNLVSDDARAEALRIHPDSGIKGTLISYRDEEVHGFRLDDRFYSLSNDGELKVFEQFENMRAWQLVNPFIPVQGRKRPRSAGDDSDVEMAQASQRLRRASPEQLEAIEGAQKQARLITSLAKSITSTRGQQTGDAQNTAAEFLLPLIQDSQAELHEAVQDGRIRRAIEADLRQATKMLGALHRIDVAQLPAKALSGQALNETEQSLLPLVPPLPDWLMDEAKRQAGSAQWHLMESLIINWSKTVMNGLQQGQGHSDGPIILQGDDNEQYEVNGQFGAEGQLTALTVKNVNAMAETDLLSLQWESDIHLVLTYGPEIETHDGVESLDDARRNDVVADFAKFRLTQPGALPLQALIYQAKYPASSDPLQPSPAVDATLNLLKGIEKFNDFGNPPAGSSEYMKERWQAEERMQLRRDCLAMLDKAAGRQSPISKEIARFDKAQFERALSMDQNINQDATRGKGILYLRDVVNNYVKRASEEGLISFSELLANSIRGKTFDLASGKKLLNYQVSWLKPRKGKSGDKYSESATIYLNYGFGKYSSWRLGLPFNRSEVRPINSESKRAIYKLLLLPLENNSKVSQMTYETTKRFADKLFRLSDAIDEEIKRTGEGDSLASLLLKEAERLKMPSATPDDPPPTPFSKVLDYAKELLPSLSLSTPVRELFGAQTDRYYGEKIKAGIGLLYPEDEEITQNKILKDRPYKGELVPFFAFVKKRDDAIENNDEKWGAVAPWLRSDEKKKELDAKIQEYERQEHAKTKIKALNTALTFVVSHPKDFFSDVIPRKPDSEPLIVTQYCANFVQGKKIVVHRTKEEASKQVGSNFTAQLQQVVPGSDYLMYRIDANKRPVPYLCFHCSEVGITPEEAKEALKEQNKHSSNRNNKILERLQLRHSNVASRSGRRGR